MRGRQEAEGRKQCAESSRQKAAGRRHELEPEREWDFNAEGVREFQPGVVATPGLNATTESER